MMTTGEKIILGATALFLCGLCLFSAMPAEQWFDDMTPVEVSVIPETIPEEDTIPVTSVSTQVELSQETVTQEATLVNLNTATMEELDTLPNIGETLAQRIIDYRTEYGDFATVDDITLVAGIGDVTLENLRIYATVE